MSTANMDQPTQHTMKNYRAASYNIDEEEYAEYMKAQLRKIYRADYYNDHDEKYAIQMNLEKIPDAFNTFTDGLMTEKYINRANLLKAIEDYNKTETSKLFPLEPTFQEAAFNCRPYRAAKYDENDEKYATQMKLHNIPYTFNEFTDDLMDEKYINRFGLLQAIDDYKKTEESKICPLPHTFQDAAFNYRPYQPCIIS